MYVTLARDFAGNSAATESVKGREVVRWVKNGVDQRLFPGAHVSHADRHGLPVIREGVTPQGCAPQQVTAGYGDVVFVR